MKRIAALIASTAILPTLAQAGEPLGVDIVAPAAGVCVNNGDEPFLGGVFGGEALPPPRDVPVELSVTGHLGDAFDVTIEVAGQAVVQRTVVPANAGAETVELLIPAFSIEDGAMRGFTARINQNAAEADDVVQFDLDREPPRLVVDLDELPALDECYDMPPVVPYVLEDAIDDNPMSAEVVNSEGCIVTRTVTVSDACGNAQEVSLITLRPAPAPIEVSVQAYRCRLDDCVTEGPDADPVAPGTLVGTATASFDATGPEGCVQGLQARWFLDEDPPAEIGPGDGAVLVPGDRLEQPGTYTIVAFANTCGGEQVRAETTVTVLDRPVAIPGGEDERLPNDPVNAPSRYTYRAVQGDALQIDGSASSAPLELGGIVRWQWDLDLDGINEFDGPDFAQVPFDTTIGDGVTLGLLSITAGNGGIDRHAFRVIIDDVLPTCDVGGPYQGVEGSSVLFDGSASAPGHPSDPLAAFNWDFGDNLFPQRGFGLVAPSHTYADAGNYQVTLVVDDIDSSSPECVAQVEIADVSPIVEGPFAFGANNLIEGDAVSFSIGTTRAGSAADPISEYCWDYGDGSPEECGPALFGPTHRYVDSGDFEVCLRVRDEEPDDVAEGCFNISVADLNPFVDIEGPAFATEGDAVSFNAIGLLAGGDIDPLTRLEWDFGDGDTEVVDLVATPMATSITHTFDDDGEFTVTVRAFDEDSFAEASLVINVADVAPSAAAEARYPDAERLALEGVALTLSAEGSAPGNASDPIVRYDWDFGDGETGEGELVQHAWPDAGTYQVSLTVTDEDGSVASDTLTVEVINVAPRIFIESESDQLSVGEETVFSLAVLDVDADRPPPFIEWDMGDGTVISNRTTVTHAYAALGEYTVRARVDHPGELNESAETEFNITVTAAPPQFTLEAPAQPLDQVIEGREGEPLLIRVRVDSARLDADTFDGEVILSARLKPENAIFEQDRSGDNPDARKWAEIRWTPTFYEAGDYEIRLEALAPRTETTRTLILNVRIAEVGSPLLAAVGTDGSDGLANLYRYGVENGALTFNRIGTVEVGLGARGLAFDERNGRRIFVGVPSAGVAVVNTVGRPERQRVVPTGSGTAAVAWGDGRIWALNADARTLSIIDPDTLKIDRTVDLDGVSRPYDMAWVGGDDPRLVVVDARDGAVSVFDPAVLDGGDGTPEAQAVIGGALDRVVVDESGLLTISDRKTRAIYQLSVAAVADAAPDVTGFSTVFMPRDLTVSGDAVLIATDGGIWRIEDGRITPPDNREQAASSITTLPEAFVSEGGLVIGEAERIYNYNPELDRLIGAPGSRMRRLAAFVALEDD